MPHIFQFRPRTSPEKHPKAPRLSSFWLHGIRLATLLAVGFCSGIQARETPKEYTSDSDPPYTAKWGDYTILVDQAGEGERVRVRDAKGRVVQEIRAPFVGGVTFPDLDGKGGTDFVSIVVCPGNNLLAEIRTYVYSKRGGLQNILELPYAFDEVRDLDGDGRPEIISHNEAPFEWIDSVSHAADPALFMVLKWNGKAYEFQNRAFAKTVREHAVGLARAMEPQLAKVLKDPPKESYVYGGLRGQALGYWAALATIGEEKVAEEWLRTRMSEREYGIFLESVGEIRDRLEKVPKMVRTEKKTRIVRD